MIVLGIHGGTTIRQHEAGAAIAVDGVIVAACEEERYTRIKSSRGCLPLYSIRACLKESGIKWDEIDLVVSPGETYAEFSESLNLYLGHNFGPVRRLELVHHQLAHLASGFYASEFDEAACLSLDATGDGSSGFLGRATRDGGIEVMEQRASANSLGMFYTLMTNYLGFGDTDEYKVMGLAPFGKPSIDLSEILAVEGDDYELRSRFFRSVPAVRSPYEPMFAPALAEALGAPPRRPSDEVTPFHQDVAASTQSAFEEAVMAMARRLRAAYPEVRNLAFAGGSALNCTANGKLIRSGLFDQVYLSPVSSDRGLAIGCAYLGASMLGDQPKPMATAYLGSGFSTAEIETELKANGCVYRRVDNPSEAAAEMLEAGKVIGWFQGRSEAGARALGNRSILASADDPKMKDHVNARIKYREEFRPFAPVALYEQSDALFETGGIESPYMCVTFQARPDKQDVMPSVVHVDGSARLQTVTASQNQRLHDLLAGFAVRKGDGVVMNTSFNLKGQPIVDSPRDALMTFAGCGLDALVLGDFVLEKTI